MADQPASRADAVEKLADLIKDVRVAMLTTWDEGQQALRARPMWTQNERFDGKLYFFTGKDSAKVHEASARPHVGLSYADPDDDVYVSVSGRASVSTDRALLERFYDPSVRAWFPGGLDDPQLALLVVEVDAAEYWDTPSSRLVQIAGFVKAVATRTTYEPDENVKLDL